MEKQQSYWNNWLDKRIPAASLHRLNHKNIFIFPSKFGGLFLLLCVLLFLLGTNYQNNLMLLLCYFLLSLFLINLLVSYINFARIELQIGKCPEVFVGDNLHLPLWLNADNTSQAPPSGILRFRFQEPKSKALKKLKNASATEIDADAFSNPVHLSHRCQKRGKLNLSRVTVDSAYPLGLYRCWTHLAFTHQVMVYPKLIPCDIRLLNADHKSAKKRGQQNQQSGHDDFSHLKAYQLGEPLHHVAWKHLAKGRGMVSKQFSSQGSQIGWLKLNQPTNYKNIQQRLDALEIELGKLCYQVIELSRTGQTFGLDLGSQCIAPSSGAAHRTACLTSLACFTSQSSQT